MSKNSQLLVTEQLNRCCQVLNTQGRRIHSSAAMVGQEERAANERAQRHFVNDLDSRQKQLLITSGQLTRLRDAFQRVQHLRGLCLETGRNYCEERKQNGAYSTMRVCTRGPWARQKVTRSKKISSARPYGETPYIFSFDFRYHRGLTSESRIDGPSAARNATSEQSAVNICYLHPRRIR